MKKHSQGEPSLADRMQQPEARGLVAAAVAWSLAWKGVSLWQAARDGSKPWFATLLVTNTLGILDAVYLFGISRARHDGRDRT